MQTLKVIIAGGGTGGHIFPAVAIAHALLRKKPETEILFVGANGKMEMEKIPQEGFRIVGLDIAGFNRSSWIKNISLPFKLLKSSWKARSVIAEFRPDIVIGVGGYASFPVLNAAQRKGIPTLIQEQNSHAGKSNKILGKKAKAVCVAYENMEKFFPANSIIKTGNPVRANISVGVPNCNKEAALEKFELHKGLKTLLVVGGSLGARSINESILKHLDDLQQLGIQVIWQTGKPFFETAKGSNTYPDTVKVHDFIRDMEKAYCAADIVVSRAGALAIAELCIVGKPVIFVPYPYAAEDHQTSNAKALADNNAAIMIADHEVKDKLIVELKKLTEDKTLQEEMGRNIRSMAITDADERIAALVIELVNKKNV